MSASALRARRAVGRAVRTLAGAAGYDVVRRSTSNVEPRVPEGELFVPAGRSERFVVGDYDVLPRGRYDVVERNYYSPVPHLDELPADIFDRRSELPGVVVDGEAAMELVETQLAPYIAELASMPNEGPRPPAEFFLHNDNYGPVDAELLYAMVRRGKPQRIIELGSGFTSLMINDAVRRNAEEGASCEYVAYDPYPRAFILGDSPPAGIELRPLSATDVPMAEFASLGAGDILFVDTTHTVKLGSDVNHIILDVLPLLSAGVVVHFHDIFLPFEYPRAWFTEFDYLWAEQYLMQAFLAFNSGFEVVLPAQLLAADFAERLAAVVPSCALGVRPGAFWMRRT
jgi:hypothetical protein